MKMLEVVLETLNSKFLDLAVIREKRLSRIISAYSETNNELPPNVDSSGRLHAPCDGYEDMDGRGVYGKGEFLPVPDFVFEQLEREGLSCDRGSKEFGLKSKVLISADDSIGIMDTLLTSYGLSSSTGKHFERNGLEMCYLYVTGNDPLVKVMEEAINKFKIEEREIKKLSKGEAPCGKQTVMAKIVFIKTIEPATQLYCGSYKMMCELENKATVWGTLPKSLHGAKVGDTFSLKGAFKQADGITLIPS